MTIIPNDEIFEVRIFWFFIEFTLFFLLPVLIYKLLKKPVMEKIKERIVPQDNPPKKRFWNLLIGIEFGILLTFVSKGLRLIEKWIWGERYTRNLESKIIGIYPEYTIVQIIITILVFFLLNAFSEEFLFRGILFRDLNNKSTILAYIVSNLFFMIFHKPPGFFPLETLMLNGFYYFMMGVIFCYIVKLNKFDLFIATIVHGTFNSINFLLHVI